MHGKSVSAHIIALFVLLRIIPSGKSKVLVSLGFLIWMILILCCSAVYVYRFTPAYDDMAKNAIKSIPWMFQFLSAVVIPVMQVLITIPVLAYFCHCNPKLVHDKALPCPQYIMMFIIKAILITLACFLNLKFLSDLFPEDVPNIFVLLITTLWYIGMIITDFIIGTSSRQICRRVADKELQEERISRGITEELSKDVKNFKNGLSPILFIIFSTRCILLINIVLVENNSYTVLYLLNLTLGISLILDLIYISLTLEKTMSAIKDVTSKLRYVRTAILSNVLFFRSLSFYQYFIRSHLDGCNKKEHILHIISELECPFSALGFFNIERSTLTSLVSTILTYLIILVQFEQSKTGVGDHGRRSCNDTELL